MERYELARLARECIGVALEEAITDARQAGLHLMPLGMESVRLTASSGRPGAQKFAASTTGSEVQQTQLDVRARRPTLQNGRSRPFSAPASKVSRMFVGQAERTGIADRIRPLLLDFSNQKAIVARLSAAGDSPID